MAKDHPDPVIRKLLDHLVERQDDRVGVTALSGRAVSRSATNVHLAVPGGIVAVPIANITGVFTLASQPDAVRIEVRNPQQIQPLLQVRPVGSGNGIGSGGGGTKGGGTVEAARDGEIVFTDRTFKDYIGVGTCTYTDTDTVSGGQGQPDQCDDSVPDNCPADDTAG
jgi:hypothetical protein